MHKDGRPGRQQKRLATLRRVHVSLKALHSSCVVTSCSSAGSEAIKPPGLVAAACIPISYQNCHAANLPNPLCTVRKSLHKDGAFRHLVQAPE
jgi:hypothetical protein